MPAQTERQRAIQTQIRNTWSHVFMQLNAWSATRPQCDEMILLPAEKRGEYVRKTWGDQALLKAGPGLTRIEILERELAGTV